MTINQLVGLLLIIMGLGDLLLAPKLLDHAWRKAPRPPSWSESLNIIVRLAGILFIFFGLSYYFFGQLS